MTDTEVRVRNTRVHHECTNKDQIEKVGARAVLKLKLHVSALRAAAGDA